MPEQLTIDFNPRLELDIELARIHPDPFQPRVDADDELKESVRAQGILQAISVEPAQVLDAICSHCSKTFAEIAAAGDWMINDGERRYRGAIAAGQKTILAKIIPAMEEGPRLVRQVTANAYKPLTPIEEAFAFKRIMDAEGLSQADVARKVGKPRSVVGDRIRLVELHPAWLDLIQAGKLQTSHAPIIYQYRAVPDEYQVKAAKNLQPGAYEEGISVASFRTTLHQAFRDYIVPLNDVRSYKGPVLEVEERSYSYSGPPTKKVKYAADIELWRPIKRAKEKRAKSEMRSSASGHSPSPRYESPIQRAVKVAKSAGIEIPVRKTKQYNAEPNDGEVTILSSHGSWGAGIHPKVLLEKLDPSKLTLVRGTYGEGDLVTSDIDAVAAAQAAYRAHAANISKSATSTLREKLTPDVLEKHAVKGPGAAALLSLLSPEEGKPKVVALALGLAIDGDLANDDYDNEAAPVLADAKRSDAEKLLSALAAIAELELDVPDPWTLDRQIQKGLSDVPFTLAKKPNA